WLTRDADLSSTEHTQVLVNDVWIDWSDRFAPVPNFQTQTFQIAGERSSHVLSVHRADGLVTYLYGPTWGQLTTWDDAGNPVNLACYQYLAAVDTGMSWTLFDENTGEDLGVTTTVVEGWHPWYPAPP